MDSLVGLVHRRPWITDVSRDTARALLAGITAEPSNTSPVLCYDTLLIIIPLLYNGNYVSVLVN